MEESNQITKEPLKTVYFIQGGILKDHVNNHLRREESSNIKI